jgi:hypothetical protein
MDYEVMIIVMRNLKMVELLRSLDTLCKAIEKDAAFSMSVFQKQLSRDVTVISFDSEALYPRCWMV